MTDNQNKENEGDLFLMTKESKDSFSQKSSQSSNIQDTPVTRMLRSIQNAEVYECTRSSLSPLTQTPHQECCMKSIKLEREVNAIKEENRLLMADFASEQEARIASEKIQKEQEKQILNLQEKVNVCKKKSEELYIENDKLLTLERELETFSKKYSTLNNKSHEMEYENTKLKEDLKNVKEDYMNINKKLCICKHDLMMKERSVEKLQTALDDTQDTCSQQEDNIVMLTGNLEELTSKVRQLQDELDIARADLDAKCKEASALVCSHNEYNSDSLQEELQHVNGESKRRYKEENVSLQKEMDTVEEEVKEKNCKLSMISTLKKSNLDLGEKLRAAEEANMTLKGDILTGKYKIDDFKAKLSDSRSLMKDKEVIIAGLNETIESYQNDIKEMKKKIALLQNTVDEEVKEKNCKLSIISTLEKSNLDLGEKLRAAEEASMTLKGDILTGKHKIDDFKAKLSDSRSLMKDKEVIIAGLDETIKSYQNDIEEMKKKIALLQNTVDEEVKEKNCKLSMISTLEKSNLDLGEKLRAAEEASMTLKGDILTGKHELESVKSKPEVSNDELHPVEEEEAASDKLETALNQLKSAEDESALLRSQLDDLKRKLLEATSSVTYQEITNSKLNKNLKSHENEAEKMKKKISLLQHNLNNEVKEKNCKLSMISTLEKSNLDLGEKLRAAEEANITLKGDILTGKHELVNLKTKLGKANGLILDEKIIIDKLNENIENYRKENEKIKQEITILRKSCKPQFNSKRSEFESHESTFDEFLKIRSPLSRSKSHDLLQSPISEYRDDFNDSLESSRKCFQYSSNLEYPYSLTDPASSTLNRATSQNRSCLSVENISLGLSDLQQKRNSVHALSVGDLTRDDTWGRSRGRATERTHMRTTQSSADIQSALMRANILRSFVAGLTVMEEPNSPPTSSDHLELERSDQSPRWDEEAMRTGDPRKTLRRLNVMREPDKSILRSLPGYRTPPQIIRQHHHLAAKRSGGAVVSESLSPKKSLTCESSLSPRLNKSAAVDQPITSRTRSKTFKVLSKFQRNRRDKK